MGSCNVNTGTRVNGSSDQSNNSIVEKYCYNDIDANCQVYGGLYQWAEALQIASNYNATAYGTQSWMNCDPCGSNGKQGICPTGYHIPTDLEWSRYEYCVETSIAPVGSTHLVTFQTSTGWRGSDVAGVGAGDKMKVTSINSPSWDGTNTSGFDALPSGYRSSGGSFGGMGINPAFFTATEYNASSADRHSLYTGYAQVDRSNLSKTYGFSVRCLKDAAASCTPPAAPVAGAASNTLCSSFKANWTASSGATNYFLDVATDAGFNTYVTGYHDSIVGNVTSLTVTGLTPATTYYYRLRATKGCLSTNSGTMSATTSVNPSTAGSITGTTPVCKGQNGVSYSVNSIAGATAYKWIYSGTGFTIPGPDSTTNTITANFASNATSGNLTVFGYNACDSSTVSPAFAIIVKALPTTANAGSDQSLSCDFTTTTLAGNTPTSGTGLWTVVSGTATITSPVSPTSGVTGLASSGMATLRWTIRNAPCDSSSDDVIIFTSVCGSGPVCGTQEWAPANLNVGTLIPGAPDGQKMFSPGGDQKYCYNDVEANCNTYGGLYEWNEAMNYASTINCDPCLNVGVQGICPANYHMPTDLEWSRYEQCVETSVIPVGTTALASFQTTSNWRGSSTAGVGPGAKMKVTSGNIPSWDGTNTSLFAAMSAGYRKGTDGAFYELGTTANYWTATEFNSTNAYSRKLQTGFVQSSRNYYNKNNGYSVRCMKNTAPVCTPPASPVASTATLMACTSFTANWAASSGAFNYVLDVSTNSGFSSFVTGYNNLYVGNVTTYNITGLTFGNTYYYRVRAIAGCASGNSNVITAATTGTPANAGAITGTATVCQGLSGINYKVGAITNAASYTWTYTGTGLTVTNGINTDSVIVEFASYATSGNLTVTGTNACTSGTPSSTFAILVKETPTIANAGVDQTLTCDTWTTTLAGNTPAVGTGLWTVVSGTATITTPTSPTSGVTGLLPGATKLRWTISNAPCDASTDDVVIIAAPCGPGPICGTQEWAVANINVGTIIAGTPSGQNMTTPGGDQKYCYNDIEANCDVYGGLYEWGEAMGYASSSTCDPCNNSGVQGIVLLIITYLPIQNGAVMNNVSKLLLLRQEQPLFLLSRLELTGVVLLLLVQVLELK